MQYKTENGTISAFTLRESRNGPSIAVVIYSILFHVLVFLVLPLTTKLFWKPKTFERPKTFRLVTAPAPAARAAPPKPAPVTRKTPRVQKPDAPATPKPSTAQKAAPKASPQQRSRQQEDLSELAELLGGLPMPITELSMSGDIQDYYKLAMQHKIEQHWKPAVNNPDIAVVVSFTVHYNGSISGLSVAGSSGNASLDNTALRAVQLAAPFGKLPPGFTQRKLDVRCTLRPTRR